MLLFPAAEWHEGKLLSKLVLLLDVSVRRLAAKQSIVCFAGNPEQLGKSTRAWLSSLRCIWILLTVFAVTAT